MGPDLTGQTLLFLDPCIDQLGHSSCGSKLVFEAGTASMKLIILNYCSINSYPSEKQQMENSSKFYHLRSKEHISIKRSLAEFKHAVLYRRHLTFRIQVFLLTQSCSEMSIADNLLHVSCFLNSVLLYSSLLHQRESFCIATNNKLIH